MSKYRSPFNAEVTCTAGYPTYPSGKPHSGEDYVVKTKTEANWKLYAVADGVVYISKKQTGSYAGGYGAYGNYLVIQHTDGKWSLYAHMKDVPLVKAGQKVKAGDHVGYAGNTGNSTGRHLHIEISNMKGVGYDGASWYTQHCAHRVKPSDYVDFAVPKPTPTPTPTPEEGFEVKTWKNGSTAEKVYQTTTDCKSKKNAIGSLDPRETCDCYGIVDGCYLLAYKVTGTSAYKTGFVKYAGGVK